MPDPSTSFRSILVPLDGSALAEQALPIAERITQRTGAKLRLALVHRTPSAPLDQATAKLYTSIELAVRKSERDYLRGIQTKLRDDGARVSSTVTLTGGPGLALADYAREVDVDLVVMATHGHGGIRRAWLGSVADHLIRHLDVPVLLVRPDESRPAPERRAAAGRILVPLDGSRLAEEALGPAAELARVFNAELNVLQVVGPVVLAELPIPAAHDEELTALARSDAQDYLDSVAQRLRDQGLRATGVAVVGWNAAGSILDAAHPDSVAVVVLATHGRGGLRRLALGSVADKLVRGADVPVLVYRPAGRVRRTARRSRAAASRRPRAGLGRK